MSAAKWMVMSSGPKEPTKLRQFDSQMLPTATREYVQNRWFHNYIEALEFAVNQNSEYVWLYDPEDTLLWRFHNKL